MTLETANKAKELYDEIKNLERMSEMLNDINVGKASYNHIEICAEGADYSPRLKINREHNINFIQTIDKIIKELKTKLSKL